MRRELNTAAAIDPGDAHVGFAIWKSEDKEATVKGTEFPAEKFLPFFSKLISEGGLDLVVIEAFVLYPHRARTLGWSAMATSEMIGAVRWIAGEAGVWVVMQGADVKNVTRRQCHGRGINYKHKSGHAEDAQLHLLYCLLKNDIVQGW